MYDQCGNIMNSSSYRMANTFNDASSIVKQSFFIDAVIRGLVTQPSEAIDRNVVNDLWNSLFR